MRREELCLRGILEVVEHVPQFIARYVPTSLTDSELVGSAAVQRLCILGEAEARVSEELEARPLRFGGPGLRGAATPWCTHTWASTCDAVSLAASKQCPSSGKQTTAVLGREFPDAGHQERG